MAAGDRKSSKRAVPFAVDVPDRIPKQRYYDQELFDLEAEQLWKRTWQMACRLEEIPDEGDFATYEILGQSVIVVRTADGGARAFQNSCRHRGVQIAEGRGRAGSAGFVCPFHGWCYGADGANTFVPQSRTFSDHNLERSELDLVGVQCDTWGGCAWINLDPTAPPLRECIEPFASVMDAWKLESMRAEWWYAARIPANWKICEEAFVEQYHVLEAHPQLRLPGRYPAKDGSLDPVSFKKGELSYLRLMSRGMAGMVHASDVKIAEQLAKTIKLPKDPAAIRETWDRTLNDKVTAWHRKAGHDMPDINELEDSGMNQPMGYCFPHFFVLPMYSSASSYRFRPIGPEETLMEIWSLTRFAPGEEPETPPVPEVWECDDRRWPPIPRQDFGNLPRQQRGLHAEGFEYMRLSELGEGHISNLHRTIDAFLAGVPHKKLRKALEALNVNPLEQPIVDLGLSMGEVTFADVDAGVRRTLAVYVHVLDDGRTDDVVATFTADAEVDLGAEGAHVGHDAIRAAYAAWVPRRLQRHLVLNTHVVEWDQTEAHAVSDVVFLLQGKAGWAVQLVGRYDDRLVEVDGAWLLRRRRASFESSVGS